MLKGSLEKYEGGILEKVEPPHLNAPPDVVLNAGYAQEHGCG